MIYSEKINFLPQIPDNLLDNLEKICTFKNVLADQLDETVYASYEVPNKLSIFIQSFFDFPVITRYQVIRKNLPVHTDIGIKGVKYNYILSNGGTNVITQWWDDLENPKNVIFKKQSKEFEWHTLNIETPHNVIGVTSPRVSVVVRRKKHNE